MGGVIEVYMTGGGGPTYFLGVENLLGWYFLGQGICHIFC